MSDAAARVDQSTSTGRKACILLVVMWVILPSILFLTAGTLDSWQAWIYCGILFVPMTAFVTYMIARDQEFLQRRFALKEKERTQRGIQRLGAPIVLAVYVLPGLDRRFGWSAPPLEAVIAAQAIVLASYMAILWVFNVNRFVVGDDPGSAARANPRRADALRSASAVASWRATRSTARRSVRGSYRSSGDVNRCRRPATRHGRHRDA